MTGAAAPAPGPAPEPEPEDRPPPSALVPALLALAALVLGFLSPSFAPPLAAAAEWGVSALFSVYDWVGPAVLFIALAAALAAIFNQAGGARTSARVFGYLLGRKAFALAWAIVFTGAALDLPLVRPVGAAARAGGTVVDALVETLHASLENRFLWAALLAVAAGVALRRLRIRGRGLHELEEVVEELGGGLRYVAPLFLFAFGAYVRTLPGRLPADLAGAGAPAAVPVFRGLATLAPTDAAGVFEAYLVGSALVFVACALWHMTLVLFARLVVPDFTISGYFTGYWIHVYPFLFATSSEALAMPLNVAMVRRYYKQMRANPARFIVAAGSTIDVNGTLICAVVLAGLCARLAGVPLSLADLAIAAPAVFIVSLAVPGIPGELALFVDPVATAMGIPPGGALAAFRALFLGLQVGLPDAIRTGNNSTDDCVNALLLGRLLSNTPDPPSV